MTSRARLWVLAVSTPVIAFALVGGYLGQAMTRDETFQYLRVFDDVMTLVVNNYVEPVDVDKAMRGAMRGLADGLDADSSYLTPDLVRTVESGSTAGEGDLGIDVIRQYYLRVISARDGSPAARAGLRPGDYIRAIDGRPTRDMSTYEGNRLLRGTPGSKVALLVIRGNAAEPHEVALVRERLTAPDVTSRMANTTTGYVRIAEFTPGTAARVREAFAQLARTGATRFVIDLRGTARGDLDNGIAVARLFVGRGTLAIRQRKSGREVVAADPADGAITAPIVLLTDFGTSGAAEVFAAALDGNNRAELVGERTLGRAARQQLVKLPDGSGLLLSAVRHLTPGGDDLHEKGLVPDLRVEQPDVEFGAAPPAGDPTLEKAIERLANL